MEEATLHVREFVECRFKINVCVFLKLCIYNYTYMSLTQFTFTNSLNKSDKDK